MSDLPADVQGWLDSPHGLAPQQADQLAHQVATRLPGDTDRTARQAALDAGRRLMLGDATVVAELANQLAAARAADLHARAVLQQAALMMVEPGTRGARSEAAFARRAGVDRMTMRKWLGKR